MMVWVNSSEKLVSDLREANKRWAICKQVVSLQLSNICTAASRIPLFIFFSPQTILIQNIYRNPQNSAQTADGSHCKSHSWRNSFKTMVLKSPLLIETNNVGFWAADIELLQTGQGGGTPWHTQQALNTCLRSSGCPGHGRGLALFPRLALVNERGSIHVTFACYQPITGLHSDGTPGTY